MPDEPEPDGVNPINQRRLARARRAVPPPRQPASPEQEEIPPEGRAVRTVDGPEDSTAPSHPSPEEAQNNLAVRIRRSLDERLVDLVYGLRRQENTRSSKAELVEMLLWELPEEDLAGLRIRLDRFREQAGRRF